MVLIDFGGWVHGLIEVALGAGCGFFGCGGLQFVVIVVVGGVIVAVRGYDKG